VRVLAKKSLGGLVGVPELPRKLDNGGVIGCGKRRAFWKSIGFGVKEENAHGVGSLSRQLASSILSRLNIRCKDIKLNRFLELDLTLVVKWAGMRLLALFNLLLWVRPSRTVAFVRCLARIASLVERQVARQVARAVVRQVARIARQVVRIASPVARQVARIASPVARRIVRTGRTCKK